MRLLDSKSLTCLLAISQLAQVWARPALEVSALASVEDRKDIDKRAPEGIEIPLLRVALDTYQGYRVMPGIFKATITDTQLRATAEKTFNSIISRIAPNRDFLVSVIHIPGAGLAAGTIWKGPDEVFETLAQQNAPSFWNAVPGPSQALIPGVSATSKWHAEAVAAVKAEEEFGNKLDGNQWPRGTKIYTYGRSRNVIGYKPACMSGSSSVQVDCVQWLQTLEIQVISGA